MKALEAHGAYDATQEIILQLKTVINRSENVVPRGAREVTEIMDVYVIG